MDCTLCGVFVYVFVSVFFHVFVFVFVCWLLLTKGSLQKQLAGVSPVWGGGGRGGSKQPQEQHFLLALKNPVAWTPADLLWLPSFPRYRQYSTLNHTPTNPKTHPPLHLPPGQLFNYFLHDSHTFHQYNMIYNQRMSPEILYPIPRKMASYSK